MTKLAMLLRRALRALGGEVIIAMACRLLQKPLTVRVHAVPKFVVKDWFKENNNSPGKAKVRINYVSNSFLGRFFSKVEENVPAAGLTIHTLTKTFTAEQLLEKFESLPAIHLAHIWELLTNQGRGQRGDLLVNRDPNATGYARDNICIVTDRYGFPAIVSIFWSAHYGGWLINVYSGYDGCVRWDAGSQVILLVA